MRRRLLNLFGFDVVYVCEWGTWDSKYDTVDYMMTRPIHKDMGVAPPWAKIKVVRTKTKGVN